MTEPKPTSQYMSFSHDAIRVGAVTYIDDKPDVREYLINLRRDLLRKVHDLDILIARLEKLQKTAPADIARDRRCGCD